VALEGSKGIRLEGSFWTSLMSKMISADVQNDPQQQCSPFDSIAAICAIQGHQHKKGYSPACVNEILSLNSKTLWLQSLIFSSRDKTRAPMRFHF